MIRLVAWMMLAALPPLAIAQTCDTEPSILSATFRLSTTPAGAESPVGERTLTLWRHNDLVAHQHAGEGFADVWNQVPTNRYHLIRQFEDAQRGIEYEPHAVPSGAAHWASLWQLVAPGHRAALSLQSRSGQGCDRVETYVGDVDRSHQTLTWRTAYDLPQRLVSVAADRTVTITLVDLNTDAASVRQQFDRWAGYQTTDYADIGDNEADPFLRKMIRLGFIQHGASGFYDASGNTLDGSRDHHH